MQTYFYAFLFSLCLLGNCQADLPEGAQQRLEMLHKKIRLRYGNKLTELPEQLLVASFLPSDAKVLELGGDIGRNSCMIGTILSDSRNLVTVEPRRTTIKFLKANRDANKLKFHIEPSAISKVPLIQKGWMTEPSDVLKAGYEKVSTITYDALCRKYQIPFDTLVIDCEGAFYYVLRDEPNILQGIKLIFIENDFPSNAHYQFVAEAFRQNGFQVLHNEGPVCSGGYSFYQVWKR